jgi:hypothetical protein
MKSTTSAPRPREENSGAMMRIAIAGGGSFAYILASQLCNQTAQAVIVLSRTVCSFRLALRHPRTN